MKTSSIRSAAPLSPWILTPAACVLLGALALPQTSAGFFDAPTVADYIPFTALLDQDGDGKVELLAEHFASYPSYLYRWIYLYQTLPDATLTRVWQTKLTDDSEFDPTPASPHPSCIGVGDLGPRDGREDFVIAYGKHAKVYRSSNAGQFLAPYDIVLPISETGIARSVTSGDFDGDGRGDFVLLLDASYWLFRWDPMAQAFLGERHALSGSDWTQLDTGELSGDGIDDLVVVGGQRLLVESPLHAGLSLLHGLMMPDPAAGDIDGDGDDDVVLFTKMSYRILRQGPGGTLALEATLPGGPGTDLADVDDDGDLDGICCGGGCGCIEPTYDWPSKFEISLNAGDGTFAPAFSLPSLGATRIAGAADLDGDGDVDLAGGRAIYYAPGPIAAHRPSPAPPTSNGQLEPIADVEGDGDPDFGLGLKGVWLNLGDGSATRGTPFPAAPPGVQYRGPGYLGDFDGNGAVDLLVETWKQGTGSARKTWGCDGMHLLANRGGGSFVDNGRAFALREPLSMSTTLAADSALVHDLDGDGDQDLIVRNAPGSARFSFLWFNDGTGRFTEGPRWEGRAVAAADFTQDGLTDLVTADTIGGFFSYDTLSLRKGLGGGAFDAPQSSLFAYRLDDRDVYALVEPPGSPGPALILINRSADGTDYWISQYTGSSYGTLYHTLIGFWTRGGAAAVPYDLPWKVYSSDVDGDGWEDLVYTPLPTGRNACGVLLRPSDGNFPPVSSYSDLPPSYPQVLAPSALLDVDGDGYPEVLGEQLVGLRALLGTSTGHRLQYGSSVPGTGGALPTLGVRGPLGVDDSMELRISGGRGGAALVLAISGAEASLSDWPVPGITTWIDIAHPAYRTYPFALSGATGEIGSGALAIPFLIPASYAGTSEYLQAFISDPLGTHGMSATNGLRIDYGD